MKISGVGWLLMGALAQAEPGARLQVDQVLSLEPSVNQQRRILEALPFVFQSPEDWGRLRAHLDVNLLELSDCRLMTRTVLLLNAAYKSHPQFVRPPMRGERPDPLGLLVTRIQNLVLPDPETFDNHRYPPGRMNPVRTLDDFWRDLLEWSDRHGIKSQALSDIRSELEQFKAGESGPHSQPSSVTLSRSKSLPPAQKDPPAQIASINPDQLALWVAWIAVAFGGGGLLWLILRKKGT